MLRNSFSGSSFTSPLRKAFIFASMDSIVDDHSANSDADEDDSGDDGDGGTVAAEDHCKLKNDPPRRSIHDRSS